tara:strand:- start:177 stop:446 length:270 start_codon:yes stop_codon:yes gene_type:complete
MTKKIKVLNLLTTDHQIFINGYDLETNLISAIIYASEDKRKILDDDYRNKITQEAKIEYINTKHKHYNNQNGLKKVYSSAYDMIAYYIN